MDADNIRFNALRNALYHTARRRHFERLGRWLNLAIILLGVAAIADPLKLIGVSAAWIGVAVALVGALQLVFDFSRQARDHQALQRDYYRLLAEIEATIVPDPSELSRWRGEMIRITADEPPVLRAIDAKAYNDAIEATGVFPQNERLAIPLVHRLFGGILPFEGHSYRKLSEIG